MLSTKEVIKILKKFKVDSASKYGITSLGLFGSFARNQQNETSDVDVFVTLKESDFFVLERIREELENLVHKNIDIVNYRESLRNSFKQNILNDAIYISQLSKEISPYISELVLCTRKIVKDLEKGKYDSLFT